MGVYTFQVGTKADLSVSVSAAEAAPSGGGSAGELVPGDTVEITVTATNSGPDSVGYDGTAPKTYLKDDLVVEVPLPAGLTYVSSTASTNGRTDSYDSSTGQWKPGNIAHGFDDEITIKATVDAETHGKKLATGAKIYSMQYVKSDDTGSDPIKFPVLDPKPGNNTASAELSVAAITNTDPIFHVVAGSVAENSAAGTNVGAVIPVLEPNSGDTLTYSLSGTGSGLFTAVSATGGAQLQVAQGAAINYEDAIENKSAAYYDLVLSVSDGLDQYGNADPSVDNSIGVRVNITNVDNASETLADTLSASPASPTAGDTVTLTAHVTNSPVASSALSYGYRVYNSDDTIFSGTAAVDGPSVAVKLESAGTQSTI